MSSTAPLSVPRPTTSSLTSGVGFMFLAAGLSLAASVYLFASGDHLRGIFVGLWVPSILAAGNLLVSAVRS